MIHSPIPWVGGKSRIREEILRRFPAHTCYVEVFAGAAWVLMGKDPATSKSEVLNDLDGELVNFWRVIKHRPAEFTEAASWLLASRELFNQWRKLEGVGGEIARAVRFFAIIRLGFGARRVSTSFGYKLKRRPFLSWVEARAEVKKVVDRLRIVWVERLAWEDCLRRYDRPYTFFYLDPPYRAEGAKGYRHFFTDEDHTRLADVLLDSVGAKWLLSYNDEPFIRRLYRRRGITVEPISFRYTIAKSRCKPAQTFRGRELLIRNF